MKTAQEQARDLAVEILMSADLDDEASEQGFIQVDPGKLFRFYVLNNTKEKVA
jgi:hypothetical protein